MPSYRKYKGARERRRARVRRKVLGTPERPRLSVFRSAKHIYAQIIEDVDGHTLIAVSTLSEGFDAELEGVERAVAEEAEKAAEKAKAKSKKKGKDKSPAVVAPDNRTKIKRARAVGRLIGKKAQESGLEKVIFDRNGFLYHGRVKALADGARETGLTF